ncbi:hypothetical protein [Streptomyces sp. WM6378]|uniref:hypothetical protein n=1 Tax=Streptomyces sp. WM6378 TaxID=1415557 RepID=UPI000AC49211|nr:hypothetical protein [Streptomyces sp. WM6378]
MDHPAGAAPVSSWQAPEKVIAERHALAEAVCRELQHAGFPSYVDHPNAPAERQSGACVSLDTMDGPTGGVYVSWNPSESLAETALSFMKPDRFDLLEPLIEHSVRVSSLMDEAINSVLLLAGFRTRDATGLNDLTSGIHRRGSAAETVVHRVHPRGGRGRSHRHHPRLRAVR